MIPTPSTQHSDRQYGPDSRNRLDECGDPSPEGARAALESFYFALNGQDDAVLRQVWNDSPLAQLNNPLGGVLRGGPAVADLYRQIFAGPVRLRITFEDMVEYLGVDHAVFAGHERGSYIVTDGRSTPIQIRTTRYFRFQAGRWSQFHHHGSIDDPSALTAYQRAATPAKSTP